MRNGGLIKWKGEPLYVKHYNNLPLDEKIVGEYFIEAVNADNAAITQHGFDHFEGCKHIKNLRLHQCWYVDDTALSKLYHLSDPLITLEISNCNEVTDEGLMTLNVLK
ncbi:hypothetical protein AAG570_008820 [Ranatra chinensis]|uniref:Mitochondrial ATP synthase regulatory component factor B n=1 Tax=Ranatra chinensis TaxID=642074 RepID=A0ABD0ZD64_9HEMI